VYTDYRGSGIVRMDAAAMFQSSFI
jgi:hypothetical protein